MQFDFGILKNSFKSGHCFHLGYEGISGTKVRTSIM